MHFLTGMQDCVSGMSWIVYKVLEALWRGVWNQMRRESLCDKEVTKVRIIMCLILHGIKNALRVNGQSLDLMLNRSSNMLEKAWHIINSWREGCNSHVGEYEENWGKDVPQINNTKIHITHCLVHAIKKKAHTGQTTQTLDDLHRHQHTPSNYFHLSQTGTLQKHLRSGCSHFIKREVMKAYFILNLEKVKARMIYVDEC